MRLVRFFIFGLFSSVLLAVASLVIYGRWVDQRRIVPCPQNQSSFLRSYDPEDVIKKFRCKNESFGLGHGSGASPGTQSIEHNADFEPEFTIESSRKIELMTALRNDVLRRLAFSNAQVVGKREEVNGEFKYEYVSGTSIGTISFHPPVPAHVHRNMALPSGLEDITLQIDLKETWTRPATR